MTPATQEKLAGLWLDHYTPVVAMLRGRGSSTEQAEEYTQQAFIRIGQKLERGTAGADGALLRTIAEGIRIDAWRAEHPVIGKGVDADGNPVDIRASFVSFDEQIDVEAEDEVVVYREHLDFEFAPTFDRALRALPKDERDAFVLTTLRGLTLREAAGVLGVAFKTVDRKAASATAAIGKALAA